MHVLMFVAIGLVLLGAFVLAGHLFGKGGQTYDAAWIFIWVWLAISIVNGFYGHLRAGIPVLNEIGAFIPIFGIPAALAWYLSYRLKSGE